MGYDAVFQRNEKKYRLTNTDYCRMLDQLSAHMQRDQYGLHTIASVYYDTDNFDLIRHSVQKPAFKEKLRLRCYGIPTNSDPVFLELKRKLDGVVYKRRVLLPLWEAEKYLCGAHSIQDYGQIAKEIDWFVERNCLTPKLLLAYDRIAMHGKDDPDLRITFDQNIRYREDSLTLTQGNQGIPLIPSEHILMEVKVFGSIPIWLSKLLSENKMYPCSFSKYGIWHQSNFTRKEAKQYAG